VPVAHVGQDEHAGQKTNGGRQAADLAAGLAQRKCPRGQQDAGRGDGKHGLRPAPGPQDGAHERPGEEHHRERLSNGARHGGRDRTSARGLVLLAPKLPGVSLAPTSARDRAVLAAARERRPTILDVAHFVQAHPELAYEEYECAKYILNSLSEMSEAERGLAGMPTGFRATVRGAEPGPTVGLVAVYDAVGVVRDNGALEAVHSCGHGPVSGAVVGAALALAAMREQLSGTVIVLGCPADELVSPKAISSLGSGKSRAIENGALAGVDFALYPHPESHTGVWHASRWMQLFELHVAGDGALGPGAAVLGTSRPDRRPRLRSSRRGGCRRCPRCFGSCLRCANAGDAVLDGLRQRFATRPLGDDRSRPGGRMGCAYRPGRRAFLQHPWRRGGGHDERDPRPCRGSFASRHSLIPARAKASFADGRLKERTAGCRAVRRRCPTPCR
jgi:hypothetical protein